MLSPDGATRPGHGCYPAVMSSHVGPRFLSLTTIGEEPSPSAEFLAGACPPGRSDAE